MPECFGNIHTFSLASRDGALFNGDSVVLAKRPTEVLITDLSLVRIWTCTKLVQPVPEAGPMLKS